MYISSIGGQLGEVDIWGKVKVKGKKTKEEEARVHITHITALVR